MNPPVHRVNFAASVESPKTDTLSMGSHLNSTIVVLIDIRTKPIGLCNVNNCSDEERNKFLRIGCFDGVPNNVNSFRKKFGNQKNIKKATPPPSKKNPIY